MTDKTLSTLSVPLVSVAMARKASPEASLNTAFGSLVSSHESVLVFSKKGDFLGISSPSHAIFRHRYPGTTKVRSCIIQPPHITPETSVPDVAHFMLATGIYALPVFSSGTEPEKRVLGLVQAQDLVKTIAQEKELFTRASRRLFIEEAVCLPSSASAKEAYELMRKKEESRILLIRPSGTVEGVLTRRDLQSRVIQPSNRQRFRSGKSRQGKARNFVFGAEKEARLSFLAITAASTVVRSAPAKAPKHELFLALAQGNEPSVVLVDSKGRATGIVSIRSALRAIVSLKETSTIPIVIRNQGRIPQGDREFTQALLEPFSQKYAKRTHMVRLEIGIDEQKNTAGRPMVFTVTLQALCVPGGTVTTKDTNRDLFSAVRGAMKKLSSRLSTT
ncbi:MAG: CBS domain-containing protein [bacterium]|nr:CBS domain-containing protein [bacterium]